MVRIKDVLKTCPTKTYIVMEQPGVSAADYENSHATPRLSHYMSGKNEKVRSSMVVPEVIGGGDASRSPADAISEYLRNQCGPETRITTDIMKGPQSTMGQVLEIFG
jgi:hypothetical protein